MLAKIAVRVDGEAGRLSAPERRAGREREQHRQLGQQALHDVHREVGIGHGDVDVHAEHELAARDVLQLLDEPAVAVARRDALILGARERVRTCAGEAHAERLDGGGDAAPHGLEIAAQLVDVAAHDRGHLERALHQLGMRSAFERPARELLDHLVEARAELERGRVEEHVLLLDAERQRLSLRRSCALRRSSSREYCPVGGGPQPILWAVTAVELRPGVIRYESALWETTALALYADGEAVLVDPCISAPEIAAIAGDVAARGLEVRGVLVTHADWDHVCGLYAFPGVPGDHEPRRGRAHRERSGGRVRRARTARPRV